MKKFKKIGNDLINSEGSILALCFADGEMYLSSFLNDGSGRIYFQVSSAQLYNLFLSNNTLHELFEQSAIYFCFRNNNFEKNEKSELRKMLTCGDTLMKNLPDSMVDREWLKKLISPKNDE